MTTEFVQSTFENLELQLLPPISMISAGRTA
jgi:hypothetical protein